MCLFLNRRELKRNETIFFDLRQNKEWIVATPVIEIFSAIIFFLLFTFSWLGNGTATRVLYIIYFFGKAGIYIASAIIATLTGGVFSNRYTSHAVQVLTSLILHCN